MAGDAIIATLALGGMCLLMWWLARLAKRRMGIGAGTVSNGGLRVVGKRPLDQKNALYVIEIAGGRHILIGSSTDGSVTKLDDISPEEYAAMVDDEPKLAPKVARPKLRLAGRNTNSSRAAAANEQPAGEQAIDVNGDPIELEAVETPQFASVSESFSHLLGRAKDARTARRDKRASGE